MSIFMLSAWALALGLSPPQAIASSAPARCGDGPLDGRTQFVVEGILYYVRAPHGPCADVTPAQLAGIKSLDLVSGTMLSREVRAGDFAGLTNLQELRLLTDRVPALPPDLFAGLARLRRLTLHLNVTDGPSFALPPDLFAGLTNLQELYVSADGVPVLPPDLFADLAHLRRLTLHLNTEYGTPSALPPDLFAGLTRLETLHVTAPAAAGRTLSLRSFAALGRLVELRLDTQLADPAAFAGLARLRTLHLSVPSARRPGLFGHLPALETLRLEASERLRPGDLAGLVRLRTLAV